MSRENLVQRVVEYLRDELGEDYLWQLHNHYVSETGCGRDVVDRCTDFVTEYGMGAEEAMRAIYFGKLDNWYDKCYLNGYGNIETATVDKVVDFYPLAEWFVDNEVVEFTTHLELGDDEWECEDDVILCSREEMIEWVVEDEPTQQDQDNLRAEMVKAHFWIEIRNVEIT